MKLSQFIKKQTQINPQDYIQETLDLAYFGQKGEHLQPNLKGLLHLDLPFYTSAIHGKPIVEFPNTDTTLSIEQFFAFYQHLDNLCAKATEKTEVSLTGKLIKELIENDKTCSKFLNGYLLNISAKDFEQTVLEITFPFGISKDLKASIWLDFEISIQDYQYLDLTCDLIEVENIGNVFYSNGEKAYRSTFDEFNASLIEEMRTTFKQLKMNWLDTAVPVLLDQRIICETQGRQLFEELRDYFNLYNSH